MGFPGVLNTIGTLLDRSQTVKPIFEKYLKMEGPMGPRGLGPWAQGLGLKNHENRLFLKTTKRCASKFCECSTDVELQIIDMELLGAISVFEKMWKVSNILICWVRAVDLTARLRRVIGCLQPLVLCCGSPSGFFRQQKAYW